MCGIAGILMARSVIAPGLAGGVGSAGRIAERMVERLKHRGPNGRGVRAFADEGSVLALGHARLAILDLSSAGDQPMRDEHTGNWISCNGEVYNYRELRPFLDPRPDAWRSRTDTEVILRAYGRWGKECLRELRGMFALAIWDAREHELFLARDRLGIKPLYYYAGDGFFLFASEVRALLASGLVPRRLDLEALSLYLAYQSVPAPRTLIEGIRELLPGSWLFVDGSARIREGRYWDLLDEAAQDAPSCTSAESQRRVGELLREAVAVHLVSDVPVGAFLSGGVDSSAVVALMREAGAVPRTFCVGFSERAYDESRFARQVATRFGADHHEILLTPSDVLEQLPAALAAMDQPTGDGLNTYVVSRAVRSAGVTVALSGLGGDEIFGGYPTFGRLRRAHRYRVLWRRTPGVVRAQVATAVRALGGRSIRADKLAALVEGDGHPASAVPVMRRLFSPPQRRRLLLNPAIVDNAGDPYVRLLNEAYSRAPQAGLVGKVSYAEAGTYMHDVLLRDTDQMSMAHGLEVRVPLLDHRLVEYVVGLPDDCKRPNGISKRLLIDSLGGLLPEEITRRRKRGFTLPLDTWMRGPLRTFCEKRLAPERIGAWQIFHADEVQRAWQGFMARRRDVSWSRLWILVVLEEWLERNLA
jgi:asparagine synthase (glutamine-hydrolysing)